MNQLSLIISGIVIFVMCGGIACTRYVVARRNRESLRRRLEELIGSPDSAQPLELRNAEDRAGSSGHELPGRRHLEKLLARSGQQYSATDFYQLTLLLGCLPWLLYFAIDFSAVFALIISCVLVVIPYMVLRAKADARRNKFQIQLPDAIDLMVSILRSGHSVPRAVRSVADEIPAPCGSEFAEIFQRMSLGQNLPDALARSVERYDSFELDMLRRATAIQVEVGGSLSELLEKTNATLRQRIKLKNQVRVLTAQSRLSAWIVGLMPLFVGLGMQIINPSYLGPLTETNIGKALLFLAFCAMFTGIMIMRKLSAIRV